MKQKVLLCVRLLCALLCALLLCTACAKDGEGPSGGETTAAPTYTVYFDTVGGSKVASQAVVANKRAQKPSDPALKGYVFNGWKRKSDGVFFDFKQFPVNSDLTLVADWIPDEKVYAFSRPDPSKTEIWITGFVNDVPDTEIITIPDAINGLSVVGIADNAFAEFTSETVTKITVPKSVTSIGANAFRDISGIQINVLGDLTSIGESAFAESAGLISVGFGDGLTTVPFNAFSGTSLTSITLPSSLTVIEENAFEGCFFLTTVVLPAQVARIEDSAFDNCHSLSKIFSCRTVGQPLADLIAPVGNTALSTATLYYYSESRPESGTNLWYWDNGFPKVWTK